MKKKRIYLTPPDNPAAPPRRLTGLQVPPLLSQPGSSQIQRLSDKQRAAVAAIQKHGMTSRAAQAAGVAPATINKTFKLPAVQQYLAEQLEAAGATDSKIARRIAEGLDAVEQKEAFDKSGRLLKGAERPNYTERREAAKLALRLKGMDTQDKEDASAITNQSIYNIVIQARGARGLDDAKPAPLDIEAEDAAPKPGQGEAPNK